MTGFKSKKAMAGYKGLTDMDIGAYYAFDMPKTIEALGRVPQQKYKFSRDWYVADFDSNDYNEVRAWCAEQFGPEDKFPNAWSRWQHRYEHQIHFRDKKDYVWFMLKWSS